MLEYKIGYQVVLLELYKDINWYTEEMFIIIDVKDDHIYINRKVADIINSDIFTIENFGQLFKYHEIFYRKEKLERIEKLCR